MASPASGVNGKNSALPHTVTCDSEVIVTMEHFHVEAMLKNVDPKRLLGQDPLQSVVTNRAIVVPGTVPHMDGIGFTSAIWLPYFSSAAVNWKDLKSYSKIFSMRQTSAALTKSQIKAELQAGPGGQLQALEFYSVGEVQQVGADGKVHNRPLDAAYKDHFVEAKYLVLESTNFQGVSYPVVSRIDYFKSVKDANGKPDFAVYAYVSVQAKSFVLEPEPVIPPTSSLAQRTYVLDNRIKSASGKPIGYVANNRIFAPDSKQFSNVLKLNARKENDAKKAVGSMSDRRGVLAVVFVVISGAAIAVVAWISKLQKTKTKQNTI